jgi:hypothetical protein
LVIFFQSRRFTEEQVSDASSSAAGGHRWLPVFGLVIEAAAAFFSDGGEYLSNPWFVDFGGTIISKYGFG